MNYTNKNIEYIYTIIHFTGIFIIHFTQTITEIRFTSTYIMHERRTDMKLCRGDNIPSPKTYILWSPQGRQHSCKPTPCTKP